MPKLKLFKAKKIEERNSMIDSDNKKISTNDITFPEFYGQDKASSGFNYPKNHSRVVVASLVVGIIFGFLAGIVGVIFFFSGTLSFLKVSPEDLLPAQQFRIERNEQVNVLEDERLASLNSKVANSMVMVFRKKAESANLLDNIYLPNQAKGAGFILTADGWIMTHGKAIPDTSLKYVVVTHDKQILTVDKIIFDDYSGTVFLKVKADNLVTLPLVNTSDLRVGQRLMVFKNMADSKLEAKLMRLEKKDWQDSESITKIIQNNNVANSFLFFDIKLDESFLGSPVINMSGEVVGLNIGYDGTILGRSVDDFKSAVTQILDGKDKIERNFFGVKFLDMGQVTGTGIKIKQGNELSMVNKGVYVTEVTTGSSAEKAGLKNGDIITKVGTDLIDTYNIFNRLLQKYGDGDSFTLSVLRKDVDEEMLVTVSY
ncbi:MAG: S1C family serine protease [Patescibacteria group bacterium]